MKNIVQILINYGFFQNLTKGILGRKSLFTLFVRLAENKKSTPISERACFNPERMYEIIWS